MNKKSRAFVQPHTLLLIFVNQQFRHPDTDRQEIELLFITSFQFDEMTIINRTSNKKTEGGSSIKLLTVCRQLL